MMGPILGGGMLHSRIAITGQSNAVGLAVRSDLPSDLLAKYDAAFERVYIFNKTTSAYEKLRMGVNNEGGNSSVNFGPEFGLAVRWTREVPSGILFIDKHSYGGQPISYFESGQPYFTDALTRHAGQEAWLTANGYRPRRRGWMWVQGESNNTDTQAYYSSAFETLVSDRIANSLLIDYEIRLLVQMRSGTSMYSAAIAAAKIAYAAAHPAQTKLITMSPNFGSDNLHLNAKGQTQLGYDAFSAFFNKPSLSA